MFPPEALFGRFEREIGTVVCGSASLVAAMDLDERVKLLVAVVTGFGALACGVGSLLKGLTTYLNWRDRRRSRRREPEKTQWRWK